MWEYPIQALNVIFIPSGWKSCQLLFTNWEREGSDQLRTEQSQELERSFLKRETPKFSKKKIWMWETASPFLKILHFQHLPPGCGCAGQCHYLTAAHQCFGCRHQMSKESETKQKDVIWHVPRGTPQLSFSNQSYDGAKNIYIQSSHLWLLQHLTVTWSKFRRLTTSMYFTMVAAAHQAQSMWEAKFAEWPGSFNNWGNSFNDGSKKVVKLGVSHLMITSLSDISQSQLS